MKKKEHCPQGSFSGQMDLFSFDQNTLRGICSLGYPEEENGCLRRVIENVAGGYLGCELTESEKELANKMDEAVVNAAGTAWEVIKRAFDVCG